MLRNLFERISILTCVATFLSELYISIANVLRYITLLNIFNNRPKQSSSNREQIKVELASSPFGKIYSTIVYFENRLSYPTKMIEDRIYVEQAGL